MLPILSVADSIYSLPQELIDEIMHQLTDDKESLLSLSLVSLKFRAEAQKLLFWRVWFSFTGKQENPSYKCFKSGSDEEEEFRWVFPITRAFGFLSATNNNPVVAVYIRDFAFTITDFVAQSTAAEKAVDDLNRVLRQMVNLERLQVILRVCCMAFRMADVLDNLPFQLTQLYLEDPRAIFSETDHVTYSNFISSQPRLKYLHFMASPQHPSSPPSFNFPSLDTFIGSPAAFHLLSPHLPQITILGLVDSPWSSPMHMPLSATGLPIPGRLRVLVLYSCFFSPHDLAEVAQHLPLLEVLHIVLEECTTTNRPVKRATAMLLCFPQLPCLRKLIWTARPQPGNQQRHQLSLVPRESQRTFVESWFKDLSNFEMAYFAVGPQVDIYLRWTREKHEPEMVSSLDFRGDTPFNQILFHRHFAS